MVTQYKYLGQWENCRNLKMVEIDGGAYVLTKWENELVLGQKISKDGNLTGEVKRLKPIFSPDNSGQYNVTHIEILD